MCLLSRLLPLHLVFGSCLSTLIICTPPEEGQCRLAAEATDAEVCASGYWQVIPKGSYQCVDGKMMPLTSSDTGPSLQKDPEQCLEANIAGTSPYVSSAPSVPGGSSTVEPSPVSRPGETGNSYCEEKPLTSNEDEYGIVSYTNGGRMASVYVASDTDIFRCEIKPPADGMYVAVWTRYDPMLRLTSQPKPKNCGETIHVTNPKTGVGSDALVLDRCQSCVGVGHQISDTTTADNYANGATVDLSVKLWNKLFNNAPYTVYDIVYSGPVYGGSDSGSPDELVNPYCLPKDEPSPSGAAKRG
jgi:hypothetical protein